jgi:CDP-4-dehydro-6-deoxyglucose reductase, E1
MRKVYYAKAVYGKNEINAVTNVLKNSALSLMDGKKVKEFEKKVSDLFGKKYGLMVNSGSSANLLAFASLNLKKGSEIITPTLTFSTTVAPIYQLGLKPKFIDVQPNKYVANIDHIIKAITNKTKAIIIPNLLGNIPDWKKIHNICKNKKIFLIEDSADTIGYKIHGKTTGQYSDIVTTSFYASHIVTGAGFGGMVCFNDKNFYKKAKILRAWGRSSATYNESEDIKKRFKKDKFNFNYDKKYVFLDFGYNFIPSEISAAFALEQVKNLKKNFSSRVKNFKYLKKFLSKYNHYFDLPIQDKFVKTCWLAFPLIIKKNNFFNRNDLQVYLEKNQIQTRVIFSGNILKQPLMRNKIYTKIKNCDIESNHVMQNGILIGCHHGLTLKDLEYITNTFKKFLKSKKIN